MSVKARIKNAFQQRSLSFKPTILSNPDKWLVDLLWGGSDSGTKVNQKSALQLSAIYACWKIRSETFASFPIEVIQVDSKGVETVAYDHYLYNLLHDAPNPRQTSFTYRQTQVIHLDSWGNGYAYIARNGGLKPVSLDILQPEDIEPYEFGGKLWYWHYPSEKALDSDNILHISNFSFDGIKGIDPVSVQKSNLSLSIAAQKYGENYMANGAHNKGYLSTDQSPNPAKRTEARENVLNEWYGENAGIDNVGKTAVMWGGMKYVELGAKPADAMLMEMREMSVSEIARLYRVPEEMLSDKKTTATKWEQIMLRLQQGMLPTVKNFEAEYTRKLVSIKERGKIKIRLNMDGLLRADTEAQARLFEALFRCQAISPDEIRAFRGMPPRSDGKGGEYGLPLASNIKTVEGEAGVSEEN